MKHSMKLHIWILTSFMFNLSIFTVFEIATETAANLDGNRL